MSSEGETGGELDRMVELVSIINAAEGQLLRTIAEYHRKHEQPEFAAVELAVALHWTQNRANAQLALATDLTTRLPSTLDAMRAGQIDSYKAKTLSELTVTLDAEQTRQVEQQVLAKAPTQNSATMRQYTRRVVHRIDPQGVEKRYRREAEDRTIQVRSCDDGMAELWAYLPAHLALAIRDRVNTAACQARTPDDKRTADQRRADAFVDLCLGEAGFQAKVQVTVAATTLMGLDDQPGELAGYGEIPSSVAREIAAEGTWRRLLTDSRNGALLDYGRRSYRPPAALADFVRARDKTCRFIGCLRTADKSDLDHHVPFPQGPTSANNLTALCRHHHRAKHSGRWQSKRLVDGTVVWTSPSGRRYAREPEPVLASAPTVSPVDADDRPPF